MIKNILDHITKIVNKLETSCKSQIGFIYCMLAWFCYNFMAYQLKMIPKIPALQIVFFRNIFLIIVNWIVMKSCKISVYATTSRMNRMLFIRGLFGGIGVCFYFTSLSLIPMSMDDLWLLWCALLVFWSFFSQIFSLRMMIIQKLI